MKLKFEQAFEKVDEAVQKFARLLPWTYQWKMRASLVGGSVLDVGCGKGWA